VVVVIEGKRTEDGPTAFTSWMRVRHQMLRHLDAAWEQRDGREVFGLIILEEADLTAKPWVQYATEITSPDVLSASLPHRTDEERSQIAQSFCGLTSWSRVRDQFKIPAEALLDEVLA
jgi:hypothetical protein